MTDAFVFPFRFESTGLPSVLDQDSPDEVVQNLQVLVSTDLGERVEVPTFGIEDPTFRAGPVDLDAIRDAAVEWDERAETSFTEEVEGLDGKIRYIIAQVKAGVGQ